MLELGRMRNVLNRPLSLLASHYPLFTLSTSRVHTASPPLVVPQLSPRRRLRRADQEEQRLAHFPCHLTETRWPQLPVHQPPLRRNSSLQV
jgi:hypothetical protein